MQAHYIMRFVYCLLAFGAFACKSSFLEKYPLDKVGSDDFWNTEEDVKLALTGCYAPLSIQLQSDLTQNTTEGFGALTMFWDGISDDAWARNGAFNSIATAQLEATTGGIVDNMYYVNYKAIATCNYFLANVARANLDAPTLAQYKAEVHCLRGYYYFQLCKTYGGVIITLQPEELNYSTTLKKSTKEDVVKQVLADLDTAITTLPDILYSGHVVKATALGLKARVLLSNERWMEAAAATWQIIDGGKFQIYDEFYGLFVKPGQNNNPEIIFSARYQLPNMFSSLDYQMGWDQWEQVQPMKGLVDDFECTDGEPITESQSYDPAHPYENRDPRLRRTVYVPGDPWKYGTSGVFDPATDGNNRTGFLVKKYLDTTRAPTDYSTRSDQDFVLLRYADVLLMFAEAQNEAAGPDQRIYDAVNAVRGRASVQMPPLPPDLSKEEMRQRIHHERRVEFALEGLRYFDLLRWKTAATVIPAVVNPGGANRKFLEKNYVFPFPQKEVDAYPSLEQNKDY